MDAPTPYTLLDGLADIQATWRRELQRTPGHQLRNQYHPELSPIGWHFAHCLFIEAIWLRERILNETPRAARDWHDLYFPEQSPKWRRGGRLQDRHAMLAEAVERHQEHRALLAHHDRVLAHPLLQDGYLTGFLTQHHALHLETMQQVRCAAVRRRSPCRAPPRRNADEGHAPPTQWLEIPAQTATLGSDSILAFDNEKPVHEVQLADYRIARRPVSVGAFGEFIAAGGYARAQWWTAEGWLWRQSNGVTGPLDWAFQIGACEGLGNHRHPCLPVAPAEAPLDAPVTGLSRYEAEAFACWARARLPHEAEWELAARAYPLAGTGAVWEWCANPFYPYPGFRPFPYERYSKPWFDGQHFSLRGGSRFSHDWLKRPSMRNFYTPEKRHVFAGLRLARDSD